MGSPHGFDAGLEFDELNNIIDRGSGPITVATRQLNALTNLGMVGGTLSPTFNNLTLAGLLFESAAVGITAGTTRTQAGATALTKEVNRVDTSTAPAVGTVLGDGVRLMASVAGLDVTVINNTANPIQVYGNGADTINNVAGATGVTLPPNSVEMFECAAAGAWHFDAGVGFAGYLNTVLAVDNVTAAGSTQAAATLLPADLNRVTTATANQGVKLPASASGMDVFVQNHSGQPITVYGSGLDKIDDVATATGVTQMNGSVVLYTCYTAGNWYSEGLATGYAVNPQSSSVLQTIQFSDAITAAGTTQGTATQLLSQINTVSTVAPGTGVNLPASAPGLVVSVINTGANALQVYPAQGATDTINGVAAATGVSLLPGTAANFNCTATGAWTTQTGSTKAAAANTVASAASVTLTAANITGGTANVALTFTGATAVTTLTTPTAAAIIAALHSATVGTSYRLIFVTPASVTLPAPTPGTGVTISTNFPAGATTQTALAWKEWIITVTNVVTPAVTMVATGAVGTVT